MSTQTDTGTVIDNESGEEVKDESSALLKVPEATKKSLEAMGEMKATLGALAEAHKEPVPDCSIAANYDATKENLKEVASVRIETEKHRKKGKAYYLEMGRKVDTVAKEIIKIQGPIEKKYKDAITVEDERVERLAEEAARVEAERVAAIELKINNIKAAPSKTLTVEQCEACLVKLNAIDFASYAEFSEPARHWAADSIKQITGKIETLKEQEAEVLRVAEQARLQAIEDARLKKVADDLAKQQEEFAAQQRAAAEETARKEQEIADQQAALDAAKAEPVTTLARPVEPTPGVEWAQQRNKTIASAGKVAADSAATRLADDHANVAIEAKAKDAQSVVDWCADVVKAVQLYPRVADDEISVLLDECVIRLQDSLREITEGFNNG